MIIRAGPRGSGFLLRTDVVLPGAQGGAGAGQSPCCGRGSAPRGGAGRHRVTQAAVVSAWSLESIVAWVPAVSTITSVFARVRQTDSREGRPGSRPAAENTVTCPRENPGWYLVLAMRALARSRSRILRARSTERRIRGLHANPSARRDGLRSQAGSTRRHKRAAFEHQ